MRGMIHPSDRATNFHYAIRNVVQAAEAFERQGRKITYLNIGDPQAFGFKPPPDVIEAVAIATREKFTGYSHSAGLREAREAIARYATALGTETSPDDTLITSGASEAADLVLTALVNPGDEVLLPAPAYPIYPAIINKLGAITRYYHLDQETNWQPSVAEVSSLINERTRAIILINPSNPTGAITSDATTKSLLELAARHNLLVISDEVYRDLCFKEPPTSVSVLAADSDAAVVVLESLSKTHMLAGWRVGWMRFNRTPQTRDLLAAVIRLAGGRLCSSTLAQYAIQPALEGDRRSIAKFTEEIRRRRDLATKRVAEIDGLSCLVPEAAFYLMIHVADMGGRTDEQFVLDLIKTANVLVVHGSGFGCDPRAGYFRMVYLADEQTLARAFDGIESSLRAPQKGTTAA
ncbi:MAG TPA: aminotransferase class I/II-fold pyridoxal phosphate-dependent enzyme [Pyrinomonadaceae bacterium]|nr:aminotransferase class I/II-fold pyridoxal phosphate-dependent enzyme [Pyrinomonadaceae bacterium]